MSHLPKDTQRLSHSIKDTRFCNKYAKTIEEKSMMSVSSRVVPMNHGLNSLITFFDRFARKPRTVVLTIDRNCTPNEDSHSYYVVSLEMIIQHVLVKVLQLRLLIVLAQFL